MQGASVLRQGPAELGEEDATVGVLEEDRLAVTAAPNDVMGLAGEERGAWRGMVGNASG